MLFDKLIGECNVVGTAFMTPVSQRCRISQGGGRHECGPYNVQRSWLISSKSINDEPFYLLEHYVIGGIICDRPVNTICQQGPILLVKLRSQKLP